MDVNPKNCAHEVLRLKVTYLRHYAIRLDSRLLTSVSLDSEEERCYGATCSRCGHEVFFPSASFPEIEAPRFTKAIADFERQVGEFVDADTLADAGGGDCNDSREEDKWQR